MRRNRLLFLVAIGAYKDRSMPRLPGVLRDAERLRETLTEHTDRPIDIAGWLTDGNAAKQDILDGLRRLAADASANDQVVVYLGGDACRERDETGKHWRYYLLPYDATHDTAATHGISTDELGDALKHVRARELVVILDCCHAGGLPDVRWLNESIEDLRDGWRNHFIMATARGHDEVVDQDDGGLFIPAFCDALAGKGVLPDRNGRIHAQMAWCYAANVANAEAERRGRRQLAVAAGFSAPIPLTAIREQGSNPLRRFVSSYPRSQDKPFFEEVKRLIPKSRRILMVGTGLNVLWEQNIYDLLIEHARSTGARVDVCLGNPYNPSVQNRLIEEEMWGHSPPLGQAGIERLFKTYVERVERLGATRSINVWLFEHYPTQATLIFDQRVFHYPYGYRVLGTTSPVTAVPDDGGEDVRFYVEDAERVLAESVPAEQVFRAMRDPKYLSPDWVAAAVYLVPEREEPLYGLGSAILGYDIRAERSVPVGRCPAPGFRRFVGEAAEYGFHATLGDALYFATPAALERVKAELRFLADHFPPFELSDFELTCPFHENPAIVALRCAEPSGVAEALHHEIVARVYPTAISSTYRAGTTTKSKLVDRRARFMVERYGAPWILREFEPHLTLCSSYAASEDADGAGIDAVRRALAAVRASPVRVNELCLVVKRPGARRWTIDPARFHLVGNPASQ